MSERKSERKGGARKVDKAVIVADHVSRWYGQIIAVNDLTVEIGPGITGLLGPNGAGKSTLMKMLVGQLRPSRGRLTILGEEAGSRELMRRLGYCPEHENNYDELTGLEFVTAMTELHGFDAAEAKRRAEESLAAMDLAAAQHRLIGEYSKGMRQRTKLAQALAHDPEVIFLDEPLTGCDPIARNRIIQIVKDLGARGRCVIVSSHVLHEIESMTTEILMIHKGQILAEGNIYEIREMIDRHPHRIRVDCDRPRDLAAALLREVEVKSVGLEPDAVIVETQKPDSCYPAIPQVARREGVKIVALTSPDNNLASVFKYLTEERALRAEAQS